MKPLCKLFLDWDRMDNYSFLILILIGLPVFLAVYRLIPVKGQRAALIVGSFLCLLIYDGFSAKSVLFMLASTLINYGFLSIQTRIKNKNKRKSFIWFVSLFNVAILVLAKLLGAGILGISFYTFTVIALQIDMYKSREYLSLAEHMSFLMAYPKLMMGPIARLDEFRESMDKLDHEHGLNAKNLENGLKTFIIGLSMKVLLADQLYTMWYSICVSGITGLHFSTAWLGSYAYMLELYLDFWGYSLIAIGLGEMLGLTIPVNFNDPYVSKTVAEFWRRWHVSLGQWFRDYVYIPLGGSRKGPFSTIVNLLIVWALTGIWHGMGISFMCWGMMLGLIIIIEKFTPLGRLQNTKVIGHIYIVLLMPITWMIFAHTDAKEMFGYLGCMFGLYPAGATPAKAQFFRYLMDYWYLLLIGIALLTPYPAKLYRKVKDSLWSLPVFVALFWLCIYILYSSSSNPFLYMAF